MSAVFLRGKRTYGAREPTVLLPPLPYNKGSRLIILENLGNMRYEDRYRIPFWKVTNENTHTL